jgi:glyoxylase-like metal-dependent hydrolase (beta-lactamase superfamily II)
MAEIIPIISNSFDANAYLIIDEKTALIDTGAGMDNRILRKIRENVEPGKIELVINTHGHADHCGGNGSFKNATVLAHSKEILEMKNGLLYGTYYLRGERTPMRVDQGLEEGEIIELGQYSLRVLHTPGHTPGSICLLEEEEKTLFSGDTLFPGGNFGRVDLGGNRRGMIESLERLSNLEFDLLLPGHGNPTRGGKEQARLSLVNAREFL